MEQIFDYLYAALVNNIDAVMVLLVFASGYFQRLYMSDIKGKPTFKTLLVSFVACTAYIFIAGGITNRESLAKYFFSYFMATSLYELILEPITNWIKKATPKNDGGNPLQMLILVLAIPAITGCGIVKKNTKSSKSYTDSTTTAAVSKINNKTTVSESGKVILDSHDSEAIIEFEGDAQQLAKDYAGDTASGNFVNTKRQGILWQPTFTHKIGGTSIQTNRHIKRIILKDSGIRHEIEVNKTTTAEAGKQDSSGATHVSKKTETVDKKVKRASWPVPVIFITLLAVYVGIAFKFSFFPFSTISQKEKDQLTQKS